MKPHRLSLAGLFAVGSLVTMQFPAQSIQSADGKVYFAHPPRLLNARTSNNISKICIPINYDFSLTLPNDAGEPLGKVVITPDDSISPVRFDLEETVAFEGTGDRKENQLGIDPVTADPKTQAITVVFNPPVAPGKTVMIRLFPRCNPDSGVYLYGVTAFPVGEPAHGQFLGYGRLTFSEFW